MGEVEVGSLESGDLASSHAGVGGEVQRRVEALPACGGEERAELGSGPRPRGAAGGWALSAACVVGDVAVDEAPGDGVVERGADDGVDFDRLGCEPVPVPAAAVGERVVESVEVIGEVVPGSVEVRW